MSPVLGGLKCGSRAIDTRADFSDLLQRVALPSPQGLNFPIPPCDTK